MLFAGETVQSSAQSPGSRPGFLCANTEKYYHLIHIPAWWVYCTRSHKRALIFNQASALLAGWHDRLCSEFGSKHNIYTYNSHSHKGKACAENQNPDTLRQGSTRACGSLTRGENQVRLRTKNCSEPRTVCTVTIRSYEIQYKEKQKVTWTHNPERLHSYNDFTTFKNSTY